MSKNPRFRDLDRQNRTENAEILQRFYDLFTSISRYHNDILTLLDDVEQKTFSQMSLEVQYIAGHNGVGDGDGGGDGVLWYS